MEHLTKRRTTRIQSRLEEPQIKERKRWLYNHTASATHTEQRTSQQTTTKHPMSSDLRRRRAADGRKSRAIHPRNCPWSVKPREQTAERGGGAKKVEGIEPCCGVRIIGKTGNADLGLELGIVCFIILRPRQCKDNLRVNSAAFPLLFTTQMVH